MLMRNWERCTLCPWRIIFFSRYLYMGIHCFSFRFSWRSIYLCCSRFPVYLNTHCLLWKISLFPCGFAVCCSTFHGSLNTYCLFQIFRWGFTTSFRFPWRSIACCSRYPCLLKYSLSAAQGFLECSLPLPNLTYFLKDSPPAPNSQSLSQRRSK